MTAVSTGLDRNIGRDQTQNWSHVGSRLEIAAYGGYSRTSYAINLFSRPRFMIPSEWNGMGRSTHWMGVRSRNHGMETHELSVGLASVWLLVWEPRAAGSYSSSGEADLFFVGF